MIGGCEKYFCGKLVDGTTLALNLEKSEFVLLDRQLFANLFKRGVWCVFRVYYYVCKLIFYILFYFFLYIMYVR